MIVYSPLDGDALTFAIPSKPRHCFLMTRLGRTVPTTIDAIRKEISTVCKTARYTVIDATSRVTGRDFLIKIVRQIASTPLCVGICHEDVPTKTQNNIYYELGIAQALGKETLIVKSPNADVPSDFIRTEYIPFDRMFARTFRSYLAQLSDVAEHYEVVAEQLEKNPILSIDYLRRAFLITGDARLRQRAREMRDAANLTERARNSVEMLVAAF
jgi:hypothetical protein